MKLLCFISFLLCKPLLAFTAGGGDTTRALHELATILKENNAYTIEYNMDAQFPNGGKDHLAGTIFFDAKAKCYYNDCNQYTMLYTAGWFYQANHLEKTITLINLQKEDKKTHNEREENIFRNGTLSAFLDTVLFKKAIVKSFSYQGALCSIILGFPPKNNIEKMAFSYDTATRMPVSCHMETIHAMDKQNSKNIKVVTNYTHFLNHTDTVITTDMLFTYSKKKVVLKKYNNYKLISKI